MKFGLDIGTYSIKLVGIEDNKVIIQNTINHHGKIKDAILSILKDADLNDSLSFTGEGIRIDEENKVLETKALYDAAKFLNSNTKSVIYLGNHSTYYIEMKENDYLVRKNGNCSSGTGSFFEEQANRLNIKIEDISNEILKAKSIPAIAGRCSVFSKTDIIHHTQSGVPTPDLLNGLAYAMVRNFSAAVLKNNNVKTPVMLTGGVMNNIGVVNAIKDILKLEDKDILLPQEKTYVCALGAALNSKELKVKDFIDELNRQHNTLSKSTLKPLLRDFTYPENKIYEAKGTSFSLGVDIGSASINLVLINEKDEVVYSQYVRNTGSPEGIVQKEIQLLKEKLKDIQIDRICVTGSGREYIASKINTDLSINEISAQSRGTVLNQKDADTIFEIGGQDSKYISLSNGKMRDFEMNKVCAAGTGTFLEEQIRKLGISMEEYIDLSFKSQNPLELGNKCTVFIESSISNALARGEKLEDICAGLAYAIVLNYLHRVVGNKRIGKNVYIQGGIAYNAAVVAAFRNVLNKDVKISQYFNVTGALGAAKLANEKTNLNFDKAKNQEMNAALFKKSEEYFLEGYQTPTGNKKVIGIPRVLFLHKMFPLFLNIFKNLGFDVLLSPLSDNEILKLSQTYCSAETCYPIKLIYGHIAWLLNNHVDYILLPRMHTIMHVGSKARKDYACMFMQTSPILMDAAFQFEKRGVKLLSPVLSLQLGKRFMIQSLLSMANDLHVFKPRMAKAAVKGMTRFLSYNKQLESLGKEYLTSSEPTFIIITRAYNLSDPILNMGIEKELDRMGCRVLRLEHLEASHMCYKDEHKDMCWPFGQHILTGLNIIKEHPNFYPIYITNHSCGPDSAIQHFFEQEMKNKPYLQLEIDEHTSSVGIITRIEAFLYSLNKQEMSFEFVQPDYVPDTYLVPDFGMYTSLITKRLTDKSVQVVKPLQEHHDVSYAYNKEYHTLLLSLEEILNSISKQKNYELVYPTNEGSEVDHQYPKLICTELNKRGYHVKLKEFYLEDLMNRDDAKDLFKEMMDLERSQDNHNYLVIGEPHAVYKTAIKEKALAKLDNNYSVMPLSEALLFDALINRPHQENLKELIKLHNSSSSSLYSDLNELLKIVDKQFRYTQGNFISYRYAKNKATTSYQAIINLNSAEENAGLILKAKLEKEELNNKTIYLDVDFDHYDYNNELRRLMEETKN